MEIPFEPRNQFLLVKRLPEDNYIKSVTGLLVPTNNQDTFTERVELLKVNKWASEFVTYEIGQILHVLKGSPAPIKIKGMEYFIIKEENVLGIEK